MIEDRFVHQSPFEYEYEYRFTEYEYDEDRNALMPERWPLKMTCDAISSSPKTINPGALALSTSPTTASSSSTASLALTIGKPSVRFASSTNANYPRSSPRPKSKSFFASSTSCPQATELGQPRKLDPHSSSLLRDSLARSWCQSQGNPKVSRAQESQYDHDLLVPDDRR